MKKKYFYTVAFIMLGCFSIKAQEVEPKYKAVKLYSNFHILNTDEASIFFLPESSGFHFHNISFAFAKNKKESKRFMELELSFLYQNKDGNKDFTITTIDSTTIPVVFNQNVKTVPVSVEDIVVNLRFELGRWFKSFQNEKIKLGWSPSFKLHIHDSDLTPKTSETFPISRFQANLTLGFVPRVQYNLKPNLYLDLNFPIDIFSVGIDSQSIENPALTEMQQEQGGFSSSVIGEFLLRFGVGYRF